MANRFQNFGEALRYYRETYHERTAKAAAAEPDMPRLRVTALSLIGCLERKGYSISSGAYSELESGLSLPKDAPSFLTAVSACLSIEDGSRDWEDLVFALGWAHLNKKLGPQYSKVVVRYRDDRRSEGRSEDGTEDRKMDR